MFDLMRAASDPDFTVIPLYSDRCAAGFPSAAQDYVEADTVFPGPARHILCGPSVTL